MLITVSQHGFSGFEDFLDAPFRRVVAWSPLVVLGGGFLTWITSLWNPAEIPPAVSLALELFVFVSGVIGEAAVATIWVESAAKSKPVVGCLFSPVRRRVEVVFAVTETVDADIEGSNSGNQMQNFERSDSILKLNRETLGVKRGEIEMKF